MTESAASYLQIYLGPLQDALDRPDVTDIYINRPGELWIETLGGVIERHDAPELTEALLWRLARQIASVTHQGISREHPLLAARLPDGSRVQVVAPPATREPMAVAIRKHVSADLGLGDLEAQGVFAATRNGDIVNGSDVELARLHATGEWRAFLEAAVRARKTILVSGGTSSGKTTFLNALLRVVDPAERLVLIEDTPELHFRHENAVGLVAVRGELGETSVTADELLLASLRMRPDRIILGELRGQEALTFLRAVNTGHPGSMTTIHADSPARALDQLALMVAQAGVNLGREEVLALIRRSVDLVVQLDRCEGQRIVAEVRYANAD